MQQKRRVMVLTDISSLQSGYLEPDDAQSMVRFLLYSNEFDVEGLLATAYGQHGAHPELLHTLVQGYAQVYPNLSRHAAGYPTARELTLKIKCGSAVQGVEHIGAGFDTEASEWIVSVVKKADSRPLWVLLWGGTIDLAQAVWKIAKTEPPEITAKLLAKLRVYSIGDQYDGCGPWLRQHYPQIFYITNYHAFRGMYRGGDASLVSPEWVDTHIRCKDNPLGMLYPNYDGGDPWGRVQGIKEGDTPSFLSLLPGSPYGPETPEMGGWGGHFYRAEGLHYNDLTVPDAAVSVSKWRTAVQADFAKRLQWCLPDR